MHEDGMREKHGILADSNMMAIRAKWSLHFGVICLMLALIWPTAIE